MQWKGSERQWKCSGKAAESAAHRPVLHVVDVPVRPRPAVLVLALDELLDQPLLADHCRHKDTCSSPPTGDAAAVPKRRHAGGLETGLHHLFGPAGSTHRSSPSPPSHGFGLQQVIRAVILEDSLHLLHGLPCHGSGLPPPAGRQATVHAPRGQFSSLNARRLWKGRFIFSRATENGPACRACFVCTNKYTEKCRPSSRTKLGHRRHRPVRDGLPEIVPCTAPQKTPR